MKIQNGLWLLLFPIFSNAQDQNGIRFENELSWEQIKEKARFESKYVFMDCYATWCAPCKKMDRETYISEKVGSIVNEKFISVKLQMDSSQNDSEKIRNWYSTAKQIKRRHLIPGYPTYLFFSPEGQLVHQDEGFKTEDQFLNLINAVLDKSKQFAKILQDYKQGKKDPETITKAAKAAKKFGYKLLADSIARVYKVEHLDKLHDRELFTKENIQFVAEDFAFLIYTDGSRGRFFKYFYKYPDKVDSLLHKGYASFYIESIIRTEELTDKLFPSKQALNEKMPISKNPNWDKFERIITNKYGADYGSKIVSEYKAGFYKFIGDWRKWAGIMDKKVRATKLEKGGKNLGSFSDDWTLNDYAWDVFKYCNDKKVLKKALEWSELSIKLKKEGRGLEQYLDTKANLLYKLGSVKKAIEIEEKALALNQLYLKESGKENDRTTELLVEVIRKMKAGIHTWKTN